MTYQNTPAYPGGYYALVPPPPPGTITAARIIGWIQGGLAAVATAILIIITIVASNAVDRVDSETGGGFDSIGHDAIAVLVGFVIVVAAITAAIIIPLTRLKPGHTSAGTGLVVVEGIFLVLDLGGLTGSGSKWVLVIAMLLSISMIALLCSPSARLWLRTGQTLPAQSATGPALGQPGGSVGYGWSGAPPRPPSYSSGADGLYPGGYTGPPSMSSFAPAPAEQWASDSFQPSEQWAADPYGRHEQRLFDGVQWTAWVSDRGSVSADPIG